MVPVLDGVDTLPEQLRALAAQDHAGDWEVVIADNGSTDGSLELAERWLATRPAGRLVHATGPRSAGHARNTGAASARGDFLAFTDADDVAAPGWLAGLAEASRHGDLVAGTVDVNALNDPLPRSWHRLAPRERALTGLRFLTYASGTNTGVWADVFAQVGGFDEHTSVGEDIEFSWRAQLTGHRLASAPAAVVRERFERDVAALARQHYRYGTAGPHLYRRFRRAGMPAASAAQTLRTWSWILCAWPGAACSARLRGRWALESALACGRIAGSLRSRVLFP